AHDGNMHTYAIAKLEAAKDIINQVANGVSAWSGKTGDSPASFVVGALAQDASAVASIAIDGVVISNLDDIEVDENVKHGADVKLALLNLKNVLVKNSTEIQGLIEGIR